MKSTAPGWQIRCTKCGRTRDASEVGITRIGAWSFKKFTLASCSNCRWLRFAAIERKPPRAEANAGEAENA